MYQGARSTSVHSVDSGIASPPPSKVSSRRFATCRSLGPRWPCGYAPVPGARQFDRPCFGSEEAAHGLNGQASVYAISCIPQTDSVPPTPIRQTRLSIVIGSEHVGGLAAGSTAHMSLSPLVHSRTSVCPKIGHASRLFRLGNLVVHVAAPLSCSSPCSLLSPPIYACSLYLACDRPLSH